MLGFVQLTHEKCFKTNSRGSVWTARWGLRSVTFKDVALMISNGMMDTMMVPEMQEETTEKGHCSRLYALPADEKASK